MKKLALLFALVGTMSSAHALEISVAPLALEAKVEVLGLQVGVDGKPALILAGKAAATVAAAAGYVLNTATEVLIVTGNEVVDLVKVGVETGLKAGKYV